MRRLEARRTALAGRDRRDTVRPKGMHIGGAACPQDAGGEFCATLGLRRHRTGRGAGLRVNVLGTSRSTYETRKAGRQRTTTPERVRVLPFFVVTPKANRVTTEATKSAMEGREGRLVYLSDGSENLFRRLLRGVSKRKRPIPFRRKRRKISALLPASSRKCADSIRRTNLCSDASVRKSLKQWAGPFSLPCPGFAFPAVPSLSLGS
jgi:hypothetical protein